MKKFMQHNPVKVTIQKFYRVNGGSTQYKGIIPDIILPDPYEYLETGEKFLDYSLKWDEVKPLEYDKWDQTKINFPKLITESKKRVETSQKFSNLKSSIGILKKRKDQTSLSLNLNEYLKNQNGSEKNTPKVMLKKT